MSEKLSSTLKLSDLNDFIAPPQSCHVPMKVFRAKSKAEDGSTQANENSSLRNDQAQETSLAEPIKVTVHDCLSCSGCVTSAEAVMLEQHSISEFLSQISLGDKVVILTLSTQSRASFAAQYDFTPMQAFRKLTSFFKSLGVRVVFDTSCSKDLSLIEACEEFVRRYKRRYSSTHGAQYEQCLPVLSSTCPGWISYAEKTLGSYILPYISAIKSPQQTMGTIIKRYACYNMGLLPENVYHVTVMPCYDKKLEASRDEFSFLIDRHGESREETPRPRIYDVDCVLTSGQVLDLLQMKNVDFKSLEEVPLDTLLTNVNNEGRLYGVQGGSGGYLETIFSHAANQLFGKEINGPLNFKVLRNSDFREIFLEINGEKVLKFATCYGFRNLQNVVRKIRSGKCDYHFVEVMACPSGCLNGGGQIKPDKGQSLKDSVQKLERTYLKDVDVSNPYENPIAKGLYDDWLGHPGSEKVVNSLHTTYHDRERSRSSELSNW